MSDVSKDNVQALCRLCRIELTENELATYTESMRHVLDYVELLQEVDVSDLHPYSHIEEQGVDSLREDLSFSTLSREEFLSNAPDQVGGMIRVPPIIKQSP